MTIGTSTRFASVVSAHKTQDFCPVAAVDRSAIDAKASLLTSAHTNTPSRTLVTPLCTSIKRIKNILRVSPATWRIVQVYYVITAFASKKIEKKDLAAVLAADAKKENNALAAVAMLYNMEQCDAMQTDLMNIAKVVGQRMFTLYEGTQYVKVSFESTVGAKRSREASELDESEVEEKLHQEWKSACLKQTLPQYVNFLSGEN